MEQEVSFSLIGASDRHFILSNHSTTEYTVSTTVQADNAS